MPVKIGNSFAPHSPVGEALNNAITTYGNNIPTYGEQQEARINQNKADAPAAIEERIRALYGNSGQAGQPLTPQMVQDQIAGLAGATAMGGNLGEFGNVIRTVVANAALPESVQMIDRAQQGAGQAYNTTETGFNLGERNEIIKTKMQQDGANYRASLAANASRLTSTQEIAAADKVKGKMDFEGVLTDLRELYLNLDEGGGAVNTENSDASNVLASFANGEFGQFIGRKRGTENQSTRNQIAAKLPLLSAAIKSATGMSSIQLNSNFELQQYMKALTSPSSDIQANLKTISALSRQFGTGSLTGSSDSNDVVDMGGDDFGSPTSDNGVDVMAIPEGAKQALRNNPALAFDFDDKYGQGASDMVMSGGE